MASSAAAFHIPGADYSGAVSGGGTISFSVSADETSITNLTLSGPIGRPACSIDSRQYSQPIAISNQAFDNGEVSGSFPNVQGAYGRYDIVVTGLLSSCRIVGTWSAITRASPAGSDECKAAQAQVKDAKRSLHQAKKSGNRKRIYRARASWARARGLRDQVC